MFAEFSEECQTVSKPRMASGHSSTAALHGSMLAVMSRVYGRNRTAIHKWL